MKKTIVIPWVPPTLNKFLRMHWSERRKQLDICASYLAAFGVSRQRDPHRVRVTVQFYRSRKSDRDNNVPKVIFDAIVRRGAAVDDCERWMEQVVLAPMVDGKNPRTEITIEDADKRRGR